MWEKKRKIFYNASIKIKYSRRIYKKPINMVIFKVNLKYRVVAEVKEALRPRGNHHKNTGASFKGFPLANLRQFEHKKE